MKKPLSTLLFGSFLFAAPFCFAQTGPPQLDPTKIVERLTTLLTLTTDQQAQATTIFTNEETALTPLQASMQTARTALKAAIKSNTTATIDSLSAQLGTLSGQVTDAQSKASAAFYAILTPDQQTRYDSLPGGGFPGGMGGGRPNFRNR